MIEWYTGNFKDINWNALHIINLDFDGIVEWKELWAEDYTQSGNYLIRFKHAFNSINNMQTYANLHSVGYTSTGSKARYEIAMGLYNGATIDDVRRYSRIILALFEAQPVMKKEFFNIVFREKK